MAKQHRQGKLHSKGWHDTWNIEAFDDRIREAVIEG